MAFSCCLYDGGEAEKSEMDSIREKGWKQKFKRKDRVISPGQNRAEGKCPLTPVEVLKVLITLLTFVTYEMELKLSLLVFTYLGTVMYSLVHHLLICIFHSKTMLP